MSETKILSLDEVRIIESELAEWDAGCKYPASWNNVRALCATVRALRDERDNYADEVNALTDQLATVTEERDAIATAISEARAEVWKEIAAIDRFRESGNNVTFWCTPRAVVTQITLHDEDASPNTDKSFATFREAVEFALESAANEGVK